jgi:hypothetical protein
MRIVRKPHKRPDSCENNYNYKSFIEQGLGESERGALSGSETRKRVYRETM